ncbi:MAG: zinc-binding dehydrogenase [Alphaproteobacteria bacterium]|nr:zinc-binding dehydrogenase [Alphaproteobacteria bacterium]MCB9792814.1 zinc-binding dehydrogenase [Alphaproteobacteria bacterium]
MADMLALTFDRSREDWASSKGLVKERIPRPELIEPDDGQDRSWCVIEVLYAGFCGSDRGIWWRKAFGDMILGSLDEEQKDKRIVGHELLGRIVEVGSRVTQKYGFKPGDIVSTESHIICGACYQCRMGDSHVCARDKIIGISMDGCFAEYLKLPAKSLWPTDLSRIRPEVAAVQEPFGNAVHACQATDLAGKTVAILGTGTIGLFAVLIARGMGAAKVIGVDINPHHVDMARRLGCDAVLTPAMPPKDRPWASDPGLREQVLDLTDGVGVDVAMEMAGFNSSFNNALKIVRRGGHVVAFGVKNGDATIEDFHRVVMNGVQIHGIVGRQIFGTWEITRNLLESKGNGIQDAIWDVILNKGEDTIVDIRDWEAEAFEATISRHPKAVIRFAGV